MPRSIAPEEREDVRTKVRRVRIGLVESCKEDTWALRRGFYTNVERSG